MADPTTYYHLAGTLSKEKPDGTKETITDKDEFVRIVTQFMKMANTQEDAQGFRFVDFDAHGTISDGFLSLNWSDYGLETGV